MLAASRNPVLATIARLLVVSLAYVDTVVIFTNVWLSEDQLEELRALCGGAERYGSKSAWAWRVSLQQPTFAAIHLMLSFVRSNHEVYRFDLALDLIVRTLAAAATLQVLMEGHLVQLRHGKRKAKKYKTVAYAAPAASARNTATYSDLPSKTGLGPCCHNEFRWTGVKSCRRIGIRTLYDLGRIDVSALLQTNLVLREFDTKKINRWAAKSARAFLDDLGLREHRAIRNHARCSGLADKPLARSHVEARIKRTVFTALKQTGNEKRWDDISQQYAAETLGPKLAAALTRRLAPTMLLPGAPPSLIKQLHVWIGEIPLEDQVANNPKSNEFVEWTNQHNAPWLSGPKSK